MDISVDVDLYELIGASPAATIQEIKKAYRKKALSCHPDKNPDNPKAVELFHELSRALEILTDTSARAAYDKVLRAKHQAKQRVKQLDATRKKLKEDLEARENAYQRSLNSDYTAKNDEDKLRVEVERLRKEGSKQVEEEIAFVKRKIQDELQSSRGAVQDDIGSYKIKIKWKTTKEDSTNGGYNYDNLHRILSKYGDIAALVFSPSMKGRALVEFRSRKDAEMAANIEIGFTENPLTLRKLWTTEKKHHETSFPAKETSHSTSRDTRTPFVWTNTNTRVQPSAEAQSCPASVHSSVNRNEMSDADFELSVLRNLRKAEERKRSLAKSDLEGGT